MITELGKRRFSALLMLLGVFFALECSVPQTQTYPAVKFSENPRNIILIIGDGFGLGQLSAGLYQNGNQFSLERFPIIGLHKTNSQSDLVTDSGASATAMACGVKTYNFAIGLDQDTLPCQTILEEAESRGMATGLIASSKIMHATPAAFIAHQKNRLMYEEIALAFLETEIDLFIGGGKKYFDRRKSDERDLLRELKKRDYVILDYFNNDLFGITRLDPGHNFAFLTADDKPLSAINGRNYLPYATQLATDFLEQRSEQGFFLMIESSQIDWSCHAGDPQGFFAEMRDFDQIIKEALKFADQNRETLVLVTGDHETGGMSLVEGSKMKKVKLAFTTNGHTATLIPLYAYGPKSELFRGIYDNTDINRKMRQALGWPERPLPPRFSLPASD